MSRTRETLQTVTFYVALEATSQIYEYNFTAADFLDNLQVRQEDGNMFYTSISRDYRKIYLRNNFRINEEVFGSPIGISFTYQNGEKEWVKRADASSTHAKNLNTMVGHWMTSKTFAQWKSHINFKGHPYIGKAEDAIIVTMGYYEPEGVTPPPVVEDQEPDLPAEIEPEKPIEVSPPPEPNQSFIFVPGEAKIKEPMLANMIIRNARYRGPRESYKELMQQDEFLFDANVLYEVMDYFENMMINYHQALYELNEDDQRISFKRKPSYFDQSYENIASAFMNYSSIPSIQKEIKVLDEILSTIKEVKNHYE